MRLRLQRDNYGNCTHAPLTSNNATLVINQVLTITQPPATQTLCSGAATLSVNATGQA
jgi:hypothetical protein